MSRRQEENYDDALARGVGFGWATASSTFKPPERPTFRQQRAIDLAASVDGQFDDPSDEDEEKSMLSDQPGAFNVAGRLGPSDGTVQYSMGGGNDGNVIATVYATNVDEENGMYRRTASNNIEQNQQLDDRNPNQQPQSPGHDNILIVAETVERASSIAPPPPPPPSSQPTTTWQKALTMSLFLLAGVILMGIIVVVVLFISPNDTDKAEMSLSTVCYQRPNTTLEFDNDTYDLPLSTCGGIVIANSLEALYQEAVTGVTIEFNGDGNDVCGTESCSSAYASSDCSSMVRTSFDASSAPPISISFSGNVRYRGTSSCCEENSGVGHYIDTASVGMRMGEALCYTYKVRNSDLDDSYEAAFVMYKIGSNPDTPGGSHSVPTTSTEIARRKVIRGSTISVFKSECFFATSDGEYYLAAFAAAYDRTGGGVLGFTTLEVDSFFVIAGDRANYCQD